MISKQVKLQSFSLLASLLLALTLTACLGPDNPLILRVDTTPEAGAEDAVTTTEDAAGEEAAVVEAADVEATDIEVEEVTAEEGANENAIPAEAINFDQALMQATFLLNLEVENPTGEGIGDVDDLVIDMQTGQILYVILDRDTFLGIDSEAVALPLAAFGWNNDLEMILTADETLLDAAPGIDEDWPTEGTEGWDADIAGFWQEQALLTERNPAAAPVRVQPLIGIHAGGLGANLGIVEDFLVNWGEERLAYLAIFTTEGFYAPDQVLLVPFTTTELAIVAVDSGPTYGITLLAVDDTILNEAPSMDRSLFLTVDLMDQTFAEELNTYWSQQESATSQ